MNQEAIVISVAILWITRVALGTFLLQAAIGKFLRWPSFFAGIHAYQLLPRGGARLIGALLPVVEFVLAIGLLIGQGIVVAAAGAALLFAIFIIAVAINLRRGRLIPCHCYGIATTQAIGLGTVIRNLILFVVAMTVIWAAQNTASLATLSVPIGSTRSWTETTTPMVFLLVGWVWIIVLLPESIVDNQQSLKRR